MTRRMNVSWWFVRTTLAMTAVVALLGSAGPARAQGVTTGNLEGIVNDAQGLAVPGATVVALHEPSGTTYEAVTRGDGRFSMEGWWTTFRWWPYTHGKRPPWSC